MKPNYKALAEEYRKKWSAAEERLSSAMFCVRGLRESIAEKDREIEKLKFKYAKALDTIIDLQEGVWKGEEQG